MNWKKKRKRGWTPALAKGGAVSLISASGGISNGTAAQEPHRKHNVGPTGGVQAFSTYD